MWWRNDNNGSLNSEQVKKENKPRKRNDNEFDVQTTVILTKDTDHPYLLQIGEYVIEYLINRSHTPPY